jgi:hypothetical protein
MNKKHCTKILTDQMSKCFIQDVNTGVRDRSCSSRYCVNCARFFLLKCDIIVTNAIRCFVVYIYR